MRIGKDVRRTVQFFRRALFAVVITGLSVVCSAQSNSSVSKVIPPEVAAKIKRPAKLHEQVATYWTTEPGWMTDVQLRNNLVAEPLTVTPVIRFARGGELTLPPVVIPPSTVKSVNLNELLSSLSAPDQYGSLVFRYSSSAYRNLYAAVMIHRMGKPIMFHVDATVASESRFRGSYEGLWWIPSENSDDQAIISNHSSRFTRARLVLRDLQGKPFITPVELQPNTTIRLSISEIVKKSGIEGSAGSFSVETEQLLGISVISFVYDETAGFAAFMKTFDKNPASTLDERKWNRANVWTTRAPMMPLSRPGPALAFPKGTELNPTLLIANTSQHRVMATMRATWTKGDTDESRDIDVLEFTPGATRVVNLRTYQERMLIPADANWATITLSANCQPDDLVAVAASYDKTLRYGAQTPFTDQLAIHLEGGSWEVDANRNSILTVGNGSLRAIQASIVLFYADGQERYELTRDLHSEQRALINIGDLIRDQIPDINGRRLPPGLTSGTYQIKEVDAALHASLGSLFEAKVITDKRLGHAAYGCMVCCGYNAGQFMPYPSVLPVQAASPVTVYSQNACDGSTQAITNYYSSWWTSNGSIAGGSQGQWTGISPGQTTGAASGYIPVGDGGEVGYEPGVPPRCPTFQDAPQEPVLVGPHQVQPIYTASQGPAQCTNTSQNGWIRNVTNQVQYATGAPYPFPGLVVTDTLTIGSPNALGLSGTQTGTGTTTGDGSFDDTYFVCSSVCPGSSGESDALQSFTVSGIGLPHVNFVAYKCGSIKIDGR